MHEQLSSASRLLEQFIPEKCDNPLDSYKDKDLTEWIKANAWLKGVFSQLHHTFTLDRVIDAYLVKFEKDTAHEDNKFQLVRQSLESSIIYKRTRQPVAADFYRYVRHYVNDDRKGKKKKFCYNAGKYSNRYVKIKDRYWKESRILMAGDFLELRMLKDGELNVDFLR